MKMSSGPLTTKTNKLTSCPVYSWGKKSNFKKTHFNNVLKMTYIGKHRPGIAYISKM